MLGSRRNRAVLLAGLAFGLSGCSGQGAEPAADCSGACAEGHFETLSFGTPSASGNWYAADLNLDGKDELVLTQPSGLTRVYSFDRERGLEETATLPAATWLSIGDVTADGRPDILLGGTSFMGFRALDESKFSPLRGNSMPVTGETSGLVSVTNFPIVARWRRADSPEPIVVKDVYDLGQRTPMSTQVESFSSAAGEVASGGNTKLAVPLSLLKRFVAIDLDGDGLDELWGIDMWGKLAQLTATPADGRPGWGVAQTWSVADPVQLGLRDANGDGVPDLVGLRGGLVVTGGTSRGAGRVHELELPSAAQSCVWLQLDHDAERELVCSNIAAVAESELSAYDVDFETDELTRREGLSLGSKGRLIAGDFDGNGLEDLAALGEQLVVALGVSAP